MKPFSRIAQHLAPAARPTAPVSHTGLFASSRWLVASSPAPFRLTAPFSSSPSLSSSISPSPSTLSSDPPSPVPPSSSSGATAAAGSGGAATMTATSVALPTSPSATLEPLTLKLCEGIEAGKRQSLARAITLVESTNPKHAEQAELMLNRVLNSRNVRGEDPTLTASRTLRVGIAGPPGAGKSTFIEALGCHLVKEGHKVAVIAIDPSSSRTGGSILGDKTRMNLLSREPNAYVRPSPTRGTLGGIAQHTNDVVLLAEATGFDIVLVETVGLGQSEVIVDETVDVLLLMVPPAGGDELQGVKKGIMEVVDILVVTKADGDLKAQARHTATEYRRALQLARPKTPFWKTKTTTCSAVDGGVEDVWGLVKEFQEVMVENGLLLSKRRQQSEKWMWSSWEEQLVKLARRNPALQERATSLLPQLALGAKTPRAAAHELLDAVSAREK